MTLTAVSAGPRITTWRDAGLLGPDVVFSHCNCLYDRTEPDDEMWEAMKESDCAIASTPVDELGMAHGNPVAIEAVQRGVKCGLGAVRTYVRTLTVDYPLTLAINRTACPSMAAIYSPRCV